MDVPFLLSHLHVLTFAIQLALYSSLSPSANVFAAHLMPMFFGLRFISASVAAAKEPPQPLLARYIYLAAMHVVGCTCHHPLPYPFSFCAPILDFHVGTSALCQDQDKIEIWQHVGSCQTLTQKLLIPTASQTCAYKSASCLYSLTTKG